MIKFEHFEKGRCYCPCDSCGKEGFHSYRVISDPPKVVGQGYWDEIVFWGFYFCDDCVKKFVENVKEIMKKDGGGDRT